MFSGKSSLAFARAMTERLFSNRTMITTAFRPPRKRNSSKVIKSDVVRIPSQKEGFYGGIFGHRTGHDNSFRLDEAFLSSYREARAPFGFNGLGEFVYLRTYSRVLDGKREVWIDTVKRVVEAVFDIHRCYRVANSLIWDSADAQDRAQDMFHRMFHMKFLPPGRGLWAMGSPIIREKGLAAALNNCAFVSTRDIRSDPLMPFMFLMDLSMLGVGVGFDTTGAGSFTIHGAQKGEPEIHRIGDTREGWVESTGMLLQCYFCGTAPIDFDYSLIRPAGTPLKNFGGVASGPAPLIHLHKRLRQTLEENTGRVISVRCIVDIMNLIAQCVVSGNIRRSAEIAFGNYDDTEFLNLKNYEVHPQRKDFGWTSNNTVFAKLGMDYGPVCERVVVNGEPGFAWLDNMRNYSRMNGQPDYRDVRVSGGNPCLEQSLESMEMCCLVETFPTKHDSLEDFKQTLECALLYAKTVTLLPTHWKQANEIMFRNRRIGCSVSGVAQFICQRGLHELKTWLEEGYEHLRTVDRVVSNEFRIPESIKLTSVKPSGTISLLAGATPGIHYPEARFYLRRVRVANNDPVLRQMKNSGYHVEPCMQTPDTTSVVAIPVDAGEGVRVSREVSMWEQLSLAAFMQKYWSDNQVSATVTFDPKTTAAPDIANALEYFQYQLKAVSFLPKVAKGAYPQMPYEEISEQQYKEAVARISRTRPLAESTKSKGSSEPEDSPIPVGCDGDRCSTV